MGSQQYCLRWNNHQTAVLSGFAKLLESEALVDVTIACGGIRIKAHKVVLSACSPYFQEIFEENPCKHPVIILKGFTFQDLKSMVDFMYKGEVNVDQKHLADFLKTAEELQISGLVDVPSSSAGGRDDHLQSQNCPMDDGQRQSSDARSADAARAVPIQHEHHGAQIASCNELRERLRSSDAAAAMTKGDVAADDYGDAALADQQQQQHHLIAKQEPPDDDDIEQDPNGNNNNNYNMDSDCDGSLPMCPVDAELHVKEEVEILEEDLSVVNDASQLLLERLTRPQSSSADQQSGSATITPVMSITRSFDLASASSSHGTSSSVQMLESLPGHSSWSTSGNPGPSRSRDPPPLTGTDSAKRKKRRHASETGSDADEVNETSSSSSPQRFTKAPIKCPHCPQLFSSSTNRNRHIKHMHFLKPNERNFACYHCDRAYRRKDNLTYHLRICHPENPADVDLLRT